MSLWTLLFAISVAGALGGAANALLSDNGFLLPKKEQGIFRPGYLGNMFISALAAVISWGLYGPFSHENILGGTPKTDYTLTLATLVGALLVGVAGARWLTNETDKLFLKKAASAAATGAPSKDASAKIMAATPSDALKIAQGTK